MSWNKLQTYTWHPFSRHNRQYDFGRYFWSFLFLPVHHQLYFYPATSGFTHPNDGWMGLCIKLHCSWCSACNNTYALDTVFVCTDESAMIQESCPVEWTDTPHATEYFPCTSPLYLCLLHCLQGLIQSLPFDVCENFTNSGCIRQNLHQIRSLWVLEAPFMQYGNLATESSTSSVTTNLWRFNVKIRTNKIRCRMRT